MNRYTVPIGSVRYKDYLKHRRRIYFLVILIGLIFIFSVPLNAHADIIGLEIQDLYETITSNVKDTNDILGKAFDFSKTSPYQIINGLGAASEQGKIAVAVINASKTVSLVVATLLIMVDFFKKSINFEWSSKWENVLLFLIKIIVIKQVVQNADVIVGHIYSGFNYINLRAIGTSPDFLPCGNISEYTWTDEYGMVALMIKKGWWDFWSDAGGGILHDDFTYNISPDAVKMFYPNASIDISNLNLNEAPFANPTTRVGFVPTLEIILLQPYFLVMKAIAYIVFVVAIGRVFELCLYTIFAPLPLATFASDGTHDVAKTFIKNYIATVLQIAVIAIMFVCYSAVNKYVVSTYSGTKLIQFVVLIALGLSVIKSGTWSRKICGLA